MVQASSSLLLLGGTGPVGHFLRQRLVGQGVSVMAVSRQVPSVRLPHEIWFQHDLEAGAMGSHANAMVSLGPLSHALAELEVNPRLGRVVALSSASTQFKQHSPDPLEREQIRQLSDAEQRLKDRCQTRGIGLTLLKPTLIYAPGLDKNLSRVGGWLEQLTVAPCAGRGLRQPVHADDLAGLIVRCLVGGARSEGAWLLGGGEVINYPAMLRRIAAAKGRRLRVIPVPAWTLKLLLKLAHGRGRLSGVRSVMIDRQKVDLLVDDSPARERLGWAPRPFRP